VTILAANNEIGTIQPIAELGSVCREKGAIFHSDAVQWFGKEPISSIDQFNADLVSVCGHKFHGPKGAGLLFARSPLHPDPTQFGGSHENERRAGTENVAGIIGLAEAIERFIKDPVFSANKLSGLASKLRNAASSLPGVSVVSPLDHSLANTLSFVVAGSDSITMLANLDLEGICASSGSACSAGSLAPSHVVSAIGIKRELGTALVRFSLGRDTTDSEVAFAVSVLPEVIRRGQLTQQVRSWS
jgi:cysteine desulfurase